MSLLDVFESSVERWDLYPFGERAPTKIWNQVASHRAWRAPLAAVHPQWLSHQLEEGGRRAPAYISSIWGRRGSAGEIRVAGYLLAAVLDSPQGRALRVLRFLTYGEPGEGLDRRMRMFAAAVGLMRGCARIEWEIVEPPVVAAPVTFGMVDPCCDDGLAESLRRSGRRVLGRWTFREGPIPETPAAGDEGPSSESETLWRQYARTHLGPLLGDPIPSLESSLLPRFAPPGAGPLLFRPFPGGQTVAQWCPALHPDERSRSSARPDAADAEIIRLLRFVPGRPFPPPVAPVALLPVRVRQQAPRARRLQVGPVPESDRETSAWWDSIGFPVVAALTLYEQSLRT